MWDCFLLIAPCRLEAFMVSSSTVPLDSAACLAAFSLASFFLNMIDPHDLGILYDFSGLPPSLSQACWLHFPVADFVIPLVPYQPIKVGCWERFNRETF